MTGRRIFAGLALLALAGCGASNDAPTMPAVPGTPAMSISGTAAPGMANVDVAISTLMTRWGIPGGTHDLFSTFP